jgi:hypothetical protein
MQYFSAAKRIGTLVPREMQIVFRLLLCLVGLAAFAAAACAQAPVVSPTENINWPSPDGKFAFLTSYGEDLHTIDLIDNKSGKVCSGLVRRIRARLSGICSGRPIQIGSP